MKDTSQDFAPVKIALFKDIKYGHTMTFEYRDGRDVDGMVRISDPVEVQFTPLSNDAVIQGAIKSLEAEECKARIELERRLADIRERKSQLLALTHSQEVV